MKNILITGCGFIGKPFAELLAAANRNYNIHVVSRHPTTIKNAKWENLDILDGDKVVKFLQMHKFDVLVHSAWYCGAGLHRSQQNLDWTIATLNLVKSFCNNGGKTFLGFGSVSEYDFSYGIFNEKTTPLDNESFYGKAKTACYELCQQYCQQNNVQFKWARIFNLFGPNERQTRLVPSIVNAIRNNSDILVSNCDQKQDYSYIDDVVYALQAFLESDVEDAVNVCSGNAVCLKDIVYMICEKLSYPKSKVQFGAIKESFKYKFICGDNHRLVDEVKYLYRYNIRSGIDKLLKEV